MIPVQLLLLAKQPVPGQVKTRLCPPFTSAQAATLAAAAIADTVAALNGTEAVRRVLVRTGMLPEPPGWVVVAQRGDGLGQRLHHAFADTAQPGVASLLVGMDTPQLTPALLAALVGQLDDADAVLAPAADGGWWALLLRDPQRARVLAEVPMSTDRTGLLTGAALRRMGARLKLSTTLRDVDTAADAAAVAAQAPFGRFATTLAAITAANMVVTS